MHPHDDHHHDPGEQHHDHHHHDPGEIRLQHVVLDLGDGIGALIVHTDPELLGTEVEISPAGDDGRRSHKAVLRRRAGARDACVLVYDNLPEGTYTLWVDGVARAWNVRVDSGAVAELDWRRTSEAGSPRG